MSVAYCTSASHTRSLLPSALKLNGTGNGSRSAPATLVVSSSSPSQAQHTPTLTPPPPPTRAAGRGRGRGRGLRIESVAIETAGTETENETAGTETSAAGRRTHQHVYARVVQDERGSCTCQCKRNCLFCVLGDYLVTLFGGDFRHHSRVGSRGARGVGPTAASRVCAWHEPVNC